MVIRERGQKWRSDKRRSTIVNNRQPLLTSSPSIRANRALHGRFFDGLAARIAEAQEHFFGTVRLIQRQHTDGVLQRLDAEVVGLIGALHTIQEGSQVDQLAARIHEPEVHEIHR